MSENEYTLTQKEAADVLNVSTKSISRYRKRGLPHKLLLNPLTGKQEVRFRLADLERWDEGRQLLATYARDGEQAATVHTTRPVRTVSSQAEGEERFLADLLVAYKDQIELLREQLEDMREQLARRDRQIDDLMRLMVGLQLEYKPVATPVPIVETPSAAEAVSSMTVRREGIYEVVNLDQLAETSVPSSTPPLPTTATARKQFSRAELAQSIQRLRAKGKSFEEIALGLNRLQVAPLSGQPLWTAPEVQSLLPALVSNP